MIRVKKSGEHTARPTKRASANKGLPLYRVEEITHVPMIHRRKGHSLRVVCLPELIAAYQKRGYVIQ